LPFLTHPFNSPSLIELERGTYGIKKLKIASIFFYSPSFYSPSLNELERGTIVSRIIHISPLFFKREGKGVSCVRDAEGCGERSEPQHCLVAIVRRINTMKGVPNVWTP
jgi:hypothetical protein